MWANRKTEMMEGRLGTLNYFPNAVWRDGKGSLYVFFHMNA
jgi:hypothetical protein